MTLCELYEQARLQWQLDDMTWLSGCKKWISELEGMYQRNMQQKNFDIADLIRSIIDLVKLDIKRTEDELTQSGGSEVPQAQPGRGKTVFVLKK